MWKIFCGKLSILNDECWMTDIKLPYFELEKNTQSSYSSNKTKSTEKQWIEFVIVELEGLQILFYLESILIL